MNEDDRVEFKDSTADARMCRVPEGFPWEAPDGTIYVLVRESETRLVLREVYRPPNINQGCGDE